MDKNLKELANLLSDIQGLEHEAEVWQNKINNGEILHEEMGLAYKSMKDCKQKAAALRLGISES